MGGAWLLGQRRINRLHDGVDVVQHFVVPETKDAIALRRQERGPLFVGDDLVGLAMSAAVDLDQQPSLVTGEIREVGTDRRLATKVRVVDGKMPEMPPQLSFGVGHLAT